MRLVNTTSEINLELLRLREDGKSIGLVPTMGALHNGHLDIVQRALKENGAVVVSIFVNPTQFNDRADLDKYPRTLEADMTSLENIGEKILVFAPSVEQMYDEGLSLSTYDFNGLDRAMEGRHRPGHFQGVATIVEKLLRVIEPDRAYFGEKDYQQLQIIKRLVAQRGLDVDIIACSIVRENSGLAMSSRNARLSKRLKEESSFIHKTLNAAKVKFGTESASSVREWAEKRFEAHADFDLEYFEIADAETLKVVKHKTKGKKYRAFVAVYAEGIRLIDNVALN